MRQCSPNREILSRYTHAWVVGRWITGDDERVTDVEILGSYPGQGPGERFRAVIVGRKCPPSGMLTIATANTAATVTAKYKGAFSDLLKAINRNDAATATSLLSSIRAA